MEIVIEDFFIDQLQKCPISFQQKFRVTYQQLKIVDTPTEVKISIAHLLKIITNYISGKVK